MQQGNRGELTGRCDHGETHMGGFRMGLDESMWGEGERVSPKMTSTSPAGLSGSQGVSNTEMGTQTESPRGSA